MFSQRGLLLHYSTRRGPMSVEQAASAETLAGAPARRGETRILGPIAVGLALLSAFLTFIVLADLTPISPTHYVVVTLLLSNAATVLLLLGLIVREVWQVVQARLSGRAAARPLRRACTTCHTSRRMMLSSSSTVTAFTSNSVTTTLCVGEIGVRSARTMKVMKAESRAKPTTTGPTVRDSLGFAGAAPIVASAVAACSTVINPRRKRTGSNRPIWTRTPKGSGPPRD